MAVETPLLDTVNYPAELRKLDKSQLRQLADELREEMIDAVAEFDDEVLEKFVEGESLTIEEIKRAIRAGTISMNS